MAITWILDRYHQIKFSVYNKMKISDVCMILVCLFSNLINKGWLPSFSQSLCVIFLVRLTQESVCPMSSTPGGAPPSRACTGSNCTAHTTHSVCYSILLIFMFSTSESCCSINYWARQSWKQSHFWVVCCLHGPVLILPPVGCALPHPWDFQLKSENMQLFAGRITKAVPRDLNSDMIPVRSCSFCVFPLGMQTRGGCGLIRKLEKRVERLRRLFAQSCWTKQEKVSCTPF